MIFAEPAAKTGNLHGKRNTAMFMLYIPYSVELLLFPLGYSSTARWDGRKFHASFLRVMSELKTKLVTRKY